MAQPIIMMTTEVDTLLNQALLLINTQQTPQAQALLASHTAAQPFDLRVHNFCELHGLLGNFSEWMGVNATIAPEDDIFRFFANHPTSLNPVRDYLSDGWRTMVELQDALDLHHLSLRRCTSFLEFASGQGRFTRHLVRVLNKGQLTVSDVVPGSVDFLKSTFGVQGFYSSAQAEDLKIEKKYDVIFVLSLFSHLPTTVWSAWIRVLFDALGEQGLLVFSTHGEKCAALVGVDLSQEESKFFAASESSVLEGEAYGCTYARLAFVQHLVHTTLGDKVSVKVIPNHFWGNQDAIMVSRA